ncbi:hypothetical protein [Maribacter arcticus]|uniref:Uncharacterized protein n=1 Tax=Maribacter arcticus TaxID=561365 RepID=A0A1T5ECY1_9FLAO|nr:hypothetical protein [Maribacter arcticus]SKB81660.1 hypothetical protein SAMN05660866_03423 [Maribacter arcticus]
MLEYEDEIENETDLLRWLYFYIEKKSKKGVKQKHLEKMILKIENILNITINDELGFGYIPDLDREELDDNLPF